MRTEGPVQGTLWGHVRRLQTATGSALNKGIQREGTVIGSARAFANVL